MLGDALDYPTAGGAGPSSLLIGGILVAFRTVALVAVAVFYPVGEAAIESWPATGIAFGFLLLFELPLRGYRVRALRATTQRSDPEAPRFRPFGSLFRDGLGGLAVYTVYLFPAVLLGLLAVGGNATAAIGDPTDAFARGVAQNIAGLAVLFGLLYLVGMAYVLPAAVANYANEGRVHAAFELRRVFSGAFSEDYGVAWLVSVLFQAVAYPLSLFLWALLVGPFVQFFSAVATRYLWGHGFGQALDIATASDDDPNLEVQAPRPTVDTGGDPTDAVSRTGTSERSDAETDETTRATTAGSRGEQSSSTTDRSDNKNDGDDPMASEFDR